MFLNFEIGCYVNNTKWRGIITHVSPHTLTIEVKTVSGEIKIYRRKRKQVKISCLFNDFQIGDRCYVFDWYSEITDYENIMYNNNHSGIKEAIVTHSGDYIEIKLLNTDNEHIYCKTYYTDTDIKKTLVHRNKFLKDLDVGRYGKIKIDVVLKNSGIIANDYFNNSGYTSKSWILSKNEINNQICCITHYDCDIENCKYKNKDNRYLITFTPLNELEYCPHNGCVCDNIQHSNHFKKICLDIFNKYIKVTKKNTCMVITATK